MELTQNDKYQAWQTFREVKSGKETCFDAGIMDVFEFELFEVEWQNYLAGLEKILPSARRQEIVLEKLRKRYAWNTQRREEMLKEYKSLENRPYKERREVLGKMDILKDLKEKTAKLGHEAKYQFERFQDLSWIQPSWKEEIEKIGFEAFFRSKWWLSLVC